MCIRYLVSSKRVLECPNSPPPLGKTKIRIYKIIKKIWEKSEIFSHQGWSPPELLPITSGKVLEWDPLRSLKLSKIAALVIVWVTAGCNLVGRIGYRPRFPGVAGSDPTGG